MKVGSPPEAQEGVGGAGATRAAQQAGGEEEERKEKKKEVDEVEEVQARGTEDGSFRTMFLAVSTRLCNEAYKFTERVLASFPELSTDSPFARSTHVISRPLARSIARSLFPSHIQNTHSTTHTTHTGSTSARPSSSR